MSKKFTFSVGDMVVEKAYGRGRVKAIDENSKDFTYLVDFRAGVAWLPEKRLQKFEEKPVEMTE